jgi:hypothetical protein
MKIAIGNNLQEGPWGGGNQFLTSLVSYLQEKGDEVFFSLTPNDLDIILLTEPRQELRSSAFTDQDIEYYLRYINLHALVVHRINECDERKHTYVVNNKLVWANRVADHTVFVSNWIRDLYRKHGLRNAQKENASAILNGSNSAIFNNQDFEPFTGQGALKIVTHHWAANWEKGFAYYQKLDHLLADEIFREKYEFTYIGRLPEGFKFKNARYVEPLSGEALSKELQRHHLYLTASENEPGPNHQNEGALCGLPILYINSGSLPEYCEGYGIGFEHDDFESKLEEIRERYQEFVPLLKNYPHTAQRACDEYYQLFNDLLTKKDDLIKSRDIKRGRLFDRYVASWVDGLEERIFKFLQSLQDRISPDVYRLANQGLTDIGVDITLPFTCAAMQTYITLGCWGMLSKNEQMEMINYVKSFQTKGYWRAGAIGKGGFIDPDVADCLPYLPETGKWFSVLKETVKGNTQSVTDFINELKSLSPLQNSVLAQTQQALTVLFYLGEHPEMPYRGFQFDKASVIRLLDKVDWTQPWLEGKLATLLAVLIRTQLNPNQSQMLKLVMYDYLSKIVEPETGAYFIGKTPPLRQLIKGAKEALTILEWLQIPIHYPVKLIDTVLSTFPAVEGDELANYAYVLYRCLKQTDYRKKEIMEYLILCLKTIRHHHNRDGGFSYHIGKSIQYYEGLQVSDGAPVSDVMGTALMTWALAMIFEVCDIATE